MDYIIHVGKRAVFFFSFKRISSHAICFFFLLLDSVSPLRRTGIGEGGRKKVLYSRIKAASKGEMRAPPSSLTFLCSFHRLLGRMEKGSRSIKEKRKSDRRTQILPGVKKTCG